MTYAELVQKIRDYTEVDANVLTSTIVNGFIEDAEFRILRDVDSDNNRRYATANLVVNQRFIDLPDNALVIRSAQIVDGGSALHGVTAFLMHNKEGRKWSDINIY